MPPHRATALAGSREAGGQRCGWAIEYTQAALAAESASDAMAVELARMQEEVAELRKLVAADRAQES